ncbi:hypothetical protein ADA01nite_36340 [Aneurinibacillus danicus]|uniref:Uncharacterized protein n=1 Tax=Aneurinibacillus danicus TaxID=267746 RepID=A0A511VBF8_9BACL|nr:hypothetical protein ADA01nite_36340 [Aneurinibacillus danicus]
MRGGCYERAAFFSVKIVRKEGEKEERRSREEKGIRLFSHGGFVREH